MCYSTCCGAKAIEDFKDNVLDHHDPIAIYICSECNQECKEVTDEPESKLEKEIKMTLLDCVFDADLAQTSLLLQELRRQIICNTL